MPVCAECGEVIKGLRVSGIIQPYRRGQENPVYSVPGEEFHSDCFDLRKAKVDLLDAAKRVGADDALDDVVAQLRAPVVSGKWQ